MPKLPLRKCSKEGCPSQNISPDLTWHCYSCISPIHLLCYGVVKSSEEIFVSDNITMICDECLSKPNQYVSPKRKQPNLAANLVQRTIDLQSPTLSLSKTVSTVSSPSRNVTGKQSQQYQTVMESLVQKVDIQTATITGLQATVEKMNDTILQQKETVGESIKINKENISSIKKSLSQTPQVNQLSRGMSYADAARGGVRKANNNGTPKSTNPSGAPNNVKQCDWETTKSTSS